MHPVREEIQDTGLRPTAGKVVWKMYLQGVKEMRCEFNKGMKGRCKSHETKRMQITLGGDTFWVLCHEHALACGFTEKEWKEEGKDAT